MKEFESYLKEPIHFDMINVQFEEQYRDFTFNNKLISDRLKHVRDVCCFGCTTGLRYSDISTLKGSNI